MTYSVFDQFGVPFDVTTEVPPAIWGPSNGKLASAIGNGLGRGIVVARGPGSVEVQATVGGVTGTADVTIEPVISFEYYPAGNATCTDSCPVTEEFDVRGVSFSFTHEGGFNSSADLLQGGIYQAVADAQNHVVTKVAIGTFRMIFSLPNNGLVFDVIGNAGVGPFDNFVAYDEAGATISSEFINHTDISTYVASGGTTFRRERLTFSAPVARIEFHFDPFALLFDDFSIGTVEP
jgi:hypothetical protein